MSVGIAAGTCFEKNKWTPHKINTLIWLDAEDSSTITLNGSNISQWSDKSGNKLNAVQSVAYNQPLFVPDENTVRFNYDVMELPDASIKEGFVVVKNANGYTQGADVTPIVGTSSASDYDYIFLRTNSLDYSISIDGYGLSNGDASINGGNLSPGDGLGKDIGINGYIPFPTHNEADIVRWRTFQGNFAYNKLGSSKDESTKSIIDMCEFIGFGDFVTNDERYKIEGYLAHKWNIPDKLPCDHPYKSRRP